MPRPTSRRSSSAAHATALTRSVERHNRWREGFDPVRGLTVARARSLLAGTSRGEWAEYMWLMAAPHLGVEALDADLLALMERRTAALARMEWTVKVVDETTAGFDPALAARQAAALREAYESFRNLYALIEHLALAAFRGVAAAEKLYRPDGALAGFALVQPWNLARRGFDGDWYYNAAAANVSGYTLGDELRIAPESWLVRTVPRPLAPLALLKFISASLAERDWDAFVEIFGIPGGVVIGPPSVPVDKEKEYESAAGDIAQGGSGYLPNGAEYVANDGPRGTAPFQERAEWLQKRLILAGTGGLLSMLEGAAGLGNGGQSSVHEEVFAQIAARDARRIGELLNDAVDREILDRATPGAPRLAYWTLSLNEEPSADAAVERIAKLAAAGYRVAPKEVAERTGLTVSEAPAPPPAGPPPVARRPASVEVPNAAPAPANPDSSAAPAALLAALAEQAAPILDLVEALPDPAADPAGYREKLAELRERLPELLDASPVAAALEAAMLPVAGVHELANGRPDQPRGDAVNKGHYASSGGPLKYDPQRAKPAALHPKIAAHLGIADATVHVDAEHLASKHPELFKTPEEARAYADHVLKHATHVIPGTNRHEPTAQLIHKLSRKTAAITLQKVRGQHRVVTAHTLGHHQVGDRIAEALASGEGFEVANTRSEKDVDGEGAKVSSVLGMSDVENTGELSRSLSGPHDPPPSIITSLCGAPV